MTDPEPPAVRPLLRERLLAEGISPEDADRLLDWAAEAGRKIREACSE